MKTQRSILLLIVLSICPCVWPMATETIGNKPLNALNYTDWPGLMPLANHPSRVYQQWVNGHEWFYYDGDAAKLNDCLAKFAQVGVKVHEVLLRPGPPARAKTFDGKAVKYTWQVELMGGISKHLTTEHLGDKIWSPYPMLTVYVTDPAMLSQLRVPKGVKLLELADLKRRCALGLASTENHVRGWGAGRLARLDPYDEESMKAVARLLDDDEWWVRLCAVGALGTFGRKARPLIPKILQCADTDQKQLKEAVVSTVKNIELSAETTEKEKQHQKRLQQITAFLMRNRQQP
jgi:hypothetical protein